MIYCGKCVRKGYGSEACHESRFVKRAAEQAKKEGLREGEAKGEAKGIREMAVGIVKQRYPSLALLVQQKLDPINDKQTLQAWAMAIILAVSTGEEHVRNVLETLAE